MTPILSPRPEGMSEEDYALAVEVTLRARARREAANDAPASIGRLLRLPVTPGGQRRGANGQIERLRACACGVEVWTPLQAEAICEACRPARQREARLLSLSPAFASIPERYRWARLDSPDLAERAPHPVAAETLRALVGEPGLRALLLGPPGCGKTSLAVATLHAYLDRAVAAGGADLVAARGARFVAAHQIAAALRESKLGSTPDLVRSSLSAPVLVLDELGAEGAHATEEIARVLHDRHSAGLVTLVTSGQSQKRLTSRYGAGIWRRLSEGAVVEMLGELEEEAGGG